MQCFYPQCCNDNHRHFKAEFKNVVNLFSFFTCDRIDLKQPQIGISHKQGAIGSHTDSQGTSTGVLIFTRTFELENK